MSATNDRDEHDAIVDEKNALILEGLEIIAEQRAELDRLRAVESAARLLASGLRKMRFGQMPNSVDNALYWLEGNLTGGA